jgi:hypothetical protein
MNFATTIAALGSFDFPSAIHRLNLLCIENDTGGSDVQLGVIPPLVFTRYVAGVSGDSHVDLVTGAASVTRDIPAASNAILPGMVISTDGDAIIPAGTVVTHVIGSRVYTSQACVDTDSGFVATFTPPTLDDTTGMTIIPGEKVWLTSALHTALLQHGFRLYSEAGSTVKFMPRYN